MNATRVFKFSLCYICTLFFLLKKLVYFTVHTFTFFSQVVTSLSYIMCAALGYLSFSATADGNILKTYPASTANDVLVLSMAASIILSYPGDPSPHYSTLT
jgi:hypothetical protein